MPTDLDRLLELAAPQSHWIALDIAVGDGQTALALAPRLARVVALDLNAETTTGDAENLPFEAGSFDLVTCRLAAHRFADCFRFMQECARLLKPAGRLLIEDLLAPDDERAARYVNAFERLRDPAHNRAFADYEWRGLYLDAGLSVEHSETITQSDVQLIPWAQQSDSTPYIIDRLQIMLAQAPSAVADWLNPQCAGTSDAAFDQHTIIIVGSKPS